MLFLFYLQRHPTDKAYFIAKEILMTERTYKKDLEVINLVSWTSMTGSTPVQYSAVQYSAVK